MVTIGDYQLEETERSIAWNDGRISVAFSINATGESLIKAVAVIDVYQAQKPTIFSALQDATRTQVEAYVKTKADAGDIGDIVNPGTLLYELFAP